MDPIRSDLHTHSAHSDGTESPGELLRAARAAALDVVALTDHDTVSGWEEARAAALDAGVGLIPGVEFSTRSGHHTHHLLGYLIDPGDSALAAEFDRIRESRIARAQLITAHVGETTGLSWDEVRAQVHGDATVGRPHIADALVARGDAPDRSTAFRTLLRPPSGMRLPEYYAPTPERALSLIRGAGGVPVLAHPGSPARGGLPTAAELEAFVRLGLLGVEIRHRENPAGARARLAELARRHGLLITGSSDYHGTGKPNRLGENLTDAATLARLLRLGNGTPAILPEELRERLQAYPTA